MTQPAELHFDCGCRYTYRETDDYVLMLPLAYCMPHSPDGPTVGTIQGKLYAMTPRIEDDTWGPQEASQGSTEA